MVHDKTYLFFFTKLVLNKCKLSIWVEWNDEYKKYHKNHDNVHYITKNYVWKSIYNDENECINDTLLDMPLNPWQGSINIEEDVLMIFFMYQ